MRRLPSVVRKSVVALVFGSIGLSLYGSASAATGDTAENLAPVDVVAVSGLLDHVVVAEIETALERSATNGAQAVVLQVNSRGAVVSEARMAQLLERVAAAKFLLQCGLGQLVHVLTA